MVVYLDVYFGLNFWMDVVLIGITAGVCRERIKAWRLIAAATVGAVEACALLAIGRKWQLLGMVVSAILMMRCAFPHMRWRVLIRTVVIYIITSIFVGGAINWWYLEVSMGRGLSAVGVGVLGALVCVVWMVVLWVHRRKRRRERDTYRVLLRIQGRDIITTGFLDSGNLLCDGLGRPVHICEKELLGGVCEGLERMEVEYNVLSGNGRIEVVCGDRLVVPELNVEVENPVVGLTETSLFADGRCHMLLHGSIKDSGKSIV